VAVAGRQVRFSELIEETLEHGPQVVARRGIDTAVVISVEEWRRWNDGNRQTWKNIFKIQLPKRGTGRWRKPLVLD
jgi:antitoxin Phd